MKISVSASAGIVWLSPFTPAELESSLAVMLERFGEAGAEAGRARLELALLDDGAMAELNMDYLGCAGPTNILSFPPASPFRREEAEPDLGGMALSVETVLREAMLYGQEPAFYTLKTLAHGLAHLLGHVHGEEMDSRAEGAARAALERLRAGGYCA
ncbi:MAG: rRNA maturation RNase YbeY [Deltaproteobacteria bacterium]|jgi:probable rRNA maturation factor|nr:rRNA maturation RNase YbeY [Deltaproteobacteria bacterium]